MGRLSRFYVDPNVARTNAANGNPQYTGVQLHTSALALPIPIMWGTRRISPNVLWQSTVVKDSGGTTHPITVTPPPTPFAINNADPNGFITYPGNIPLCARLFGQIQAGIDGSHAPDTSNSYGNADGNSTDCRWWVPTILGLCEGPVNSVIRIWNGAGAAPRIGLNSNPADGVPYDIYYILSLGTSTQAVWQLFSEVPGLYPSQDINYRFTALIWSSLMDWGHDNRLQQQSFEVVRTPNLAYAVNDSYGIGKDYSLADIIPDFLTSIQYGMGFALTDIDAVSLAQFWAYQASPGLHCSSLLGEHK